MKRFKDIIDIDLDNYSEAIEPLRDGEMASEYNSFIINYNEHKIAKTNRCIPPYIMTETHGVGIYERTLNLVKSLNPSNILDLGCASGELLSLMGLSCNISTENLYGLTIHTGEVKCARENFKLNNVIPGDMRKAHEIFEGFKFDIILLHAVLQFIPTEEIKKLILSLKNIVSHSHAIIVTSYKHYDFSKVPNDTENVIIIDNMGNLNEKSIGSIQEIRFIE